VICPKCGENNANNFRFCGMCGAVLEPAMHASAPAARDGGLPVALSIPANPPKAGVEKRVEPVSGPSVLGIGQPTLDSLREKAFSGEDPFFVPEEPKTGGRKLLLLVLLAALGAAVWWTYTNYTAIGESQKQERAASNPRTNETPAATSVAQQPAPETKSSDTAKVPQPSSPAAVEKPPANAGVSPTSKPEAKTTVAAPKPAAHEKTVNAASVAKTDQHPPQRNDRTTTAAPKPAITVSAADNGEAAFRRGEAFLYGRGMPENCDEAVKNLKAASAKQHARARSTFGTMYATGHCVPRDLPTSYLWFALALRVDPNNQILEKDLSAVWNQMTPPERQLATKMKQ
jgi:hypothetical protein